MLLTKSHNGYAFIGRLVALALLDPVDVSWPARAMAVKDIFALGPPLARHVFVETAALRHLLDQDGKAHVPGVRGVPTL